MDRLIRITTSNKIILISDESKFKAKKGTDSFRSKVLQHELKPELITIYDCLKDTLRDKPTFSGAFAIYDNFDEEVYNNILKIYSVFLCSSIPPKLRQH